MYVHIVEIFKYETKMANIKKIIQMWVIQRLLTEKNLWFLEGHQLKKTLCILVNHDLPSNRSRPVQVCDKH